MDDAYGPGVKRLTACASASTGWTLPMQNWRLVSPYMDFVNIMTYDMRVQPPMEIRILTSGYCSE